MDVILTSLIVIYSFYGCCVAILLWEKCLTPEQRLNIKTFGNYKNYEILK